MTGRLIVKNGYWQIIISYKENGAYKQHWKKTDLKERGNKKIAQKQLAAELIAFEQELKERREEQRKPFSSKPDLEKLRNLPFEQYVKDYVDGIAPNLSISVSTSYYSISKILAAYFKPLRIRLVELTPEDIMNFYDYLRTKHGVKEITIKHYACIIRPALRQAYKSRIIAENPYDFVPTIHREKHRPSFYNREKMRGFFKAIEGHPLELEFKLLAYYGLRRSELLGLKWDAVDYEHKILYVRRTLLCPRKTVIVSEKLKTATSNRAFPLIPEMEVALRAREERIKEDKFTVGNDYQSEYDGFVCVDSQGGIIKPNYLTHSFEKLLKKNGLKHIRLHDLRHSCASLMLANGVQMKQIQEWLGHSNYSTTADVYSHLDFSAKQRSAEVISGILSFSDNKMVSAKEELLAEIERLKIKLKQIDL